MTTVPARPRRWPHWLLVILLLWFPVMSLGMLLYTLGSNAAPEATAALQGSDRVAVALDGFYSFTPTAVAADPVKAATGYIFYPGGLVDPAAYALYASAIADAGYPVFITPMPLDLAVFNPNAAQAVIAAHPEITHWVIGGHSLGGAMAGQFIAAQPDAIAGLVLLGAYPNGDLSGWGGQAVSIYGTLDGLASVDEVLSAAARLPVTTEFVAIEGGNHAQFGAYGAQNGDNPATLSAADQLAQAVAATLALLDRVTAGN